VELCALLTADIYRDGGSFKAAFSTDDGSEYGLRLTSAAARSSHCCRRNTRRVARDNFQLGAFHGELISYGSLPLSVIEWLMFDDDATLRVALKHE
jgi:hypothetical protein